MARNLKRFLHRAGSVVGMIWMSKEDALVKAVKSRKSIISDDDIKAIFDGLSEDIQERITNDVMAKMDDDKLGLSKDRFTVERMLSLTMVEYLKKSNFDLIKNGGVDGGKSGDSINRFFLKLIDTEEKLKESSMPKLNINVTVDDKDTVHELLIGRKREKIIDVPFESEDDEHD